MAIAKRLMKRGFTLIELMIVVVIIGILAALAIYGVQKYVSNSKSAEARTMLGRISKDQLTAFEGENQAYKVLEFGGTAAISRRLCDDAIGSPAPAGIGTATTPASVPLIQGKKWQPAPSQFSTGDPSLAGDKDNYWECLDFSVTTPLYYGYGMEATATVPAAENDSFTAFAVGDLDADTVPSVFSLGGAVKKDKVNKDLALVLATTVNEVDAEE